MTETTDPMEGLSGTQQLNTGTVPNGSTSTNTAENVDNTDNTQDHLHNPNIPISNLPDNQEFLRIKSSNKYLRSTFTRTVNFLRSQIDGRGIVKAVETTVAKLSKVHNDLSENVSSLLQLHTTDVTSKVYDAQLRDAEMYDTKFSGISEIYDDYLRQSEIYNEGVDASRKTTGRGGSNDAVENISIKFSAIRLPSFDPNDQKLHQNFTDWISLYLLAVEKVESDQVKFCYLKQNLGGEALELVENIAISPIGYNSAIKILTNHYGNPEKTLNLSIKRFVECQTLKIYCGSSHAKIYREN